MPYSQNYISLFSAETRNGAGIMHVVETPSSVLYIVYVDSSSDLVFVKSTDRGITWSAPTLMFTGTIVAVSIWYDRWSNISAGLIHCAYTESGTDDTLYRSIDTENSDTLSSQTTIFAGSTTQATGGQLSITRARGGNLYCRTCIDAGLEGGFRRSTDVGATWGSRTINEALATTDQMILLPGWAADNQDIMAFFWDADADEISRQLHDDSANTWSETSIATSMVDAGSSASFPNFAAAVDIANSRNLLVAWTATDTASADLRCWHITESTITEVTNVVDGSTDDQGLAGIAIDTSTGHWWVFYAGKTDGSETFPTSVKVYCKTSADSGTTWGPETELTTPVRNTSWLACAPRCTGPRVMFNDGNTGLLYALRAPARASFQLGI